MSIDPHSPVPIYQQIADHIRRSVAAGVYRPGEMIPSLRALALELVVNPNTVQRAYEELEREGLIRPRRGLGMCVTERAAKSARSQSAAAVRAAFIQGIRVGRAAHVPAEQIRGAFDKAWHDVGSPGKEDT